MRMCACGNHLAGYGWVVGISRYDQTYIFLYVYETLTSFSLWCYEIILRTQQINSNNFMHSH